MLARREYAVAELQRKLDSKFPEADDIEVVLARLVEEGMVCDRRFAAAFVRSRVVKMQGPRKIRAELRRRAVADTDIENALEEAVSRWTDLAEEWLQRQSFRELDYETRAKYYRRLVNRGFTHDQAMDALNSRDVQDPGV